MVQLKFIEYLPIHFTLWSFLNDEFYFRLFVPTFCHIQLYFRDWNWTKGVMDCQV